MHRYLNTTQHPVTWFKKAADAGDLEIKPPFQRNPVWSDKQKSALIDTLLLEYPVPELYMQELIDEEGGEKHVVVDGQQRIRAVLGFIEGEFELDSESPVAPGASFEDLTPPHRKKIFEYNFVIRLLPDIPDDELRAIFQRINRNTVTLNAQELRHATYWGSFIQTMEEISNQPQWNAFGIFTPNDLRRMIDVEYVSELSIAHLNGIQNKKKNLEEYYQQYEVEFEEADEIKGIFLKVLGELEQILPNLSKTRWRKKSDFYTLFLCFASNTERLPLSSEARELASKVLMDFATLVDSSVSNEGGPSGHPDIDSYARGVQRAASDLGSRRARQEALSKAIAPAFSTGVRIAIQAETDSQAGLFER